MLTKELYTRAEAADFLGVKTNTLAVWAATKRYDLSYIKVGSKAMYLKKDLDRFLENHRINMEEGNIWRQSA